jgi:energy-coupling factor transporter ATP-binding protein EcfA2
MLARENPFRIERVLRIRYQLAETDLQLLLRRWEAHGQRGALVGPEGSGKTTLLEDLAIRLQTTGSRIQWLRFRRPERAGQLLQVNSLRYPLTDRDVILIDGAEQLSWHRHLALRWRLRHAGGLLITSHRRSWLPTIWECSTSPELLIRIVEELAPQSFSLSTLVERYHRHHGNLRDVLRDLYDRCAGG